MITEVQEAQKESIRLMQKNALSMTTEARLKDVRESMTFSRAKNTIRRIGWYFTEPYAPCGTDYNYPYSICKQDV